MQIRKIQLKSLKFIFFYICLLAVDSSLAEEKSSFEKKLIKKNIEISQWFDGMADGLDVFLAGRRLTTKTNESFVKLDSAASVSTERSFESSTGLNVNLRLPNVEEYWNLKFTSYDESKERRATERSPLRKNRRENDYGASVGLFKKLGAVRASFQPQVAFGSSLKVSHLIRFESLADFKAYQVNPKFEFFARPDTGTGMFTAININFILNDIWSLTLINDGEYLEKTHLFSVSNGFSLDESLTERASLSYELIFDSNNQPAYHLNAFSLSVGFHHLIYKKILDYSCGPNLIFSSEVKFRGVPGVNCSVGLNF